MRTTIKVQIPASAFAGRNPLSVLKALANPFVRQKINRAMALEFIRITQKNFGSSGQFRPKPWPGLSESYQKRIGYHGPPKLVLKGKLIGSLRVDSSGPDHATVFSREDTATFHQHGTVNMPARPPFPVTKHGPNGQLTWYANRQLIRAAQQQIAQLIRN